MNSLKRNYELALEALEELAADLAPNNAQYPSSADQTPPRLAPMSLSETLVEFGTLPHDALFLGAAYDGLPILLNLSDPTPGPILIAGDQGSGKTDLLKIVAQATSQIYLPREVQFGVVTNHPKEWQGFEENLNCMGIFPTYHKDADNLILSLADWAHNNRSEKRFALLMIDDLEAVMQMNEDVQQNLRWLLLRGPNRRVWPLVTLNAGRQGRVQPWLDAFRTRLFGSVKNLRSAEAILPTRGAALHLLEPGLEFVLNENRQWIKFWIPSLEEKKTGGKNASRHDVV